MAPVFSLGKWLEITADADERYVGIFNRTMVLDWGKIVYTASASGNPREPDQCHRVWGLRGSRWLRFKKRTTAYEAEAVEWEAQKKFFKHKQELIAKEKEKDPLMMTDRERHQATADVVAKMKWSDTFVRAMTTPLALQALENGGKARDVMTGEELVLSPEEMKRLSGMTREDFARMRRDERLTLGKGGSAL